MNEDARGFAADYKRIRSRNEDAAKIEKARLKAKNTFVQFRENGRYRRPHSPFFFTVRAFFLRLDTVVDIFKKRREGKLPRSHHLRRSTWH